MVVRAGGTAPGLSKVLKPWELEELTQERRLDGGRSPGKPQGLHTLEVEQRRKNSRGAWEAAARKLRDVAAQRVQEVKGRKCFRVQGRGQLCDEYCSKVS